MILLSYASGFAKKFWSWRRNSSGWRKHFYVTIRKVEQLNGEKNIRINGQALSGEVYYCMHTHPHMHKSI